MLSETSTGGRILVLLVLLIIAMVSILNSEADTVGISLSHARHSEKFYLRLLVLPKTKLRISSSKLAREKHGEISDLERSGRDQIN